MDPKEELRKKLQEYANKNNIRLNPDPDVVEGLVTALLKRKEKFGDVYCPCRILTKDEQKNKEIVCPCPTHKKEIESTGHCHCTLFVK